MLDWISYTHPINACSKQESQACQSNAPRDLSASKILCTNETYITLAERSDTMELVLQKNQGYRLRGPNTFRQTCGGNVPKMHRQRPKVLYMSWMLTQLRWSAVFGELTWTSTGLQITNIQNTESPENLTMKRMRHQIQPWSSGESVKFCSFHMFPCIANLRVLHICMHVWHIWMTLLGDRIMHWDSLMIWRSKIHDVEHSMALTWRLLQIKGKSRRETHPQNQPLIGASP